MEFLVLIKLILVEGDLIFKVSLLNDELRVLFDYISFGVRLRGDLQHLLFELSAHIVQLSVSALHLFVHLLPDSLWRSGGG